MSAKKVSEKDEETESDAPELSIKVPGLVGGVAASLVAAIVGSNFGFQGTLLGAAITSIIFGTVSPFVSFGIERGRRGLQRRKDQHQAADATATVISEPALAAPSEALDQNPASTSVWATPESWVGASDARDSSSGQDASDPQERTDDSDAAGMSDPASVSQVDTLTADGEAKKKRWWLRGASAALAVVATFVISILALTAIEGASGHSVDGRYGTTVGGAAHPTASLTTHSASASPASSEGSRASATPTGSVVPTAAPTTEVVTASSTPVASVTPAAATPGATTTAGSVTTATPKSAVTTAKAAVATPTRVAVAAAATPSA